MSQFVGQDSPSCTCIPCIQVRHAPLFCVPVSAGRSRGDVSEDDIDVLLKIKHLLDFPLVESMLDSWGLLEIVALRVLPIDPMHQRLTLGIGFELEGLVAVAVRLHLLGKEGLTQLDRRLYRVDHPDAKWTITRQKENYPHGARFAHVQVRQRLGRGAGVVSPPLLVIEGHAEMRAVGKRGRCMAGYRQTEKDAEHRE